MEREKVPTRSKFVVLHFNARPAHFPSSLPLCQITASQGCSGKDLLDSMTTLKST